METNVFTRIGKGIILLFVVLFLVYVSVFIFWILGVGRIVDFDICSGHIRHQFRVLYIPVYEKNYKTELSDLLIPAKNDCREWKRVAVEPLRMPHFIPQMNLHIDTKYGDIINQVNSLSALWHEIDASDDFKRRTAGEICSLWHVSESDREAAFYLAKIQGDKLLK